MKKLTIFFAIFLLFSSLVAADTQPIFSEKPKMNIAPMTNPIIDVITLEEPTIAGEFASLTLHIQNGDFLTENIFVNINPNAPHMQTLSVPVGDLNPDKGKYLFLYLNYLEPGIFLGDIELTYDTGNSDYDFTATVSPNPTSTAPVVYDIPEISFEENNQYVLDLSDYVTDVNGNPISWTANSNEANIIVSINGQIATISATTNWNGNGEVQFHANDGTFTTDSDWISVTVFPVNQGPVMNTFEVTPETVNEGETLSAEGTFTDGDDNSLFFGVSESSSMNNCNQNTQSGCLCYVADTTSPASCDFNSDEIGVGSTTIYSHVCDSNECSNKKSDTVTVVDTTPVMNTFNVNPSTAYEFETFTAEGTFTDADDNSLFFGVSDSSSMNNCNQNTQSGCLCFETSTTSPGNCDFVGTDVGVGSHTIYSHVCDSNECSNKLSDTVTVVDTTPVMNTFNVNPSTAYEFETFTAEGTFTDADDNSLFFGVSESSSMSNCNQNDQSGCLCFETSTSSPASCDFIGTDVGVGSHTIYSHVCDSTECSNILSDTITVNDEAPTMNTFNVIETSVNEGETVNTQGTFSDPNDNNVFYGVSDSSSMSNCNQNTQSGCLCYETSTSSPSCSFNSNALNIGANTVYSHVCDTDECSNILSDSITVNQIMTVSGTVTNIFTGSAISGALVEIDDDGNIYSDTTDSNGDYSINVATQDYLAVEITKSSYTPRHTWADTNSGSVVEDYTIVSSSFNWELYNVAFRGGMSLSGYGPVNLQWGNPPDIIVFTDNVLVGGQDLTSNINTMMDNLENILPGFNPRDAIFSNVVQEATFRTQIDGEATVLWDDSIPGAGIVGIVQAGTNNPRIVKTSASFKYYVHPTNSDNLVYNQELGTSFGATYEPNFVNYGGPASDSVFHNNTPEQTYTSDDYDCAEVYLDRSRIHYQNTDYSGEDSYDWEIRPDLVSNYYPGGKSRDSKQKITIHLFGYDGSRTSTSYNLNNVPEDMKMMFPTIFPEYLELRTSEIKKNVFMDLERLNKAKKNEQTAKITSVKVVKEEPTKENTVTKSNGRNVYKPKTTEKTKQDFSRNSVIKKTTKTTTNGFSR